MVSRSDPTAADATTPMSKPLSVDFIRAHTVVASPPLVQEMKLFTATEITPLWLATEAALDAGDIPPPFWAFPWAGGQALARFVLDHPVWVAGKRVFDFASGNGMVAIAAALAGARTVIANDIDPIAVSAQQANAALNGVDVTSDTADRIGTRLTATDLLVVGDVFYERALTDRLWPWLCGVAASGTPVLIGDPGRPYLETAGMTRLATYAVPVPKELEDRTLMDASVWQVNPFAPGSTPPLPSNGRRTGS